jgi:hypothetical protein
MRKINFTVEIPDDDFTELKLIEALKVLLGDSMTNYQVLTDTKDLYENDSYFKKITSEYYKAKKLRNDYINKKLCE